MKPDPSFQALADAMDDLNAALEEADARTRRRTVSSLIRSFFGPRHEGPSQYDREECARYLERVAFSVRSGATARLDPDPVPVANRLLVVALLLVTLVFADATGWPAYAKKPPVAERLR